MPPDLWHCTRHYTRTPDRRLILPPETSATHRETHPVQSIANPLRDPAICPITENPMNESSYLADVRAQYESFPFPFRRPEDEKQRLVVSEVDRLSKIDHICFSGRRDFERPMRILVAGGGTGDALVYLAEQLRDCPAELFYVDISAASMAMAKARMEVRGLTCSRWVHGSLLDLSPDDLGVFDYINCIGVLHHLADPEAGLSCLKGVLADDGAMGLMLYGRHGRRHVYHVQRMMTLLCAGETRLQDRLKVAREALTELSKSGIVGISPEMAARLQHRDFDTYLIDTYLHEQDRPYTASEVHTFLASAGLHVAEFTNFFGDKGRATALDYDPTLFFTHNALIERTSRLSEPERQDLAELLGSAISMHAFYATPSPDTVASITDPTLAPYYPSSLGVDFRTALEGGLRELEVVFQSGLSRTFGFSGLAAATLAMVDGRRPIHALVNLATQAAPNESADRVVHSVLSGMDVLIQIGLLRLRDPGLSPLPVQEDPCAWTGGPLNWRR
jgi:SAM-dependent methyltransferase